MRHAKKIRLFAFDVDGTLTSGVLFINEGGEICKDFHVRDGMAISLLHRLGYKTAFITGRASPIVENRAKELHVDAVQMNVTDKVAVMEELLRQWGLTGKEVAFMGDDLNDLPLYEKVGVSGCPADGAPENRERADFVSSVGGGKGAAREFIRKILQEQGVWEKAVGAFSEKIDKKSI